MSWEYLPGWFDFADIYDQAVEEAPRGAVLIEVGVAFGRSLAYLARKAIDADKALQVVGVDSWPETFTGGPLGSVGREAIAEHGGFFEAFEALMDRHAAEEWHAVQIVRARSSASLQVEEKIRMWRGYGYPWFVFIDADHEYEAVREDILAWLAIVEKGGVIAGHDHTPGFPGVVRAVREVFGEGGYEVRGSSWWHRVPR